MSASFDSEGAAALRGDRLGELRRNDDEIQMRVAFRASDRQNVSDLLSLPIYLDSGARVTLGSVATLRDERAPRVPVEGDPAAGRDGHDRVAEAVLIEVVVSRVFAGHVLSAAPIHRYRQTRRQG